MQKKKLHFLVTGESGTSRSFVIEQRTLRTVLLVTGAVILCSALGTFLGVRSHLANTQLTQEVLTLRHQIKSTEEGLQSKTKNHAQLLSELQEKNNLLRQYRQQIEQSVTKLEERSQAIDSIMDSIGVEVIIEEDPAHSGGPFIAANEPSHGKQLLLQTDRYLRILEKTPFGRPLPTKVTSPFGPRRDPLNKRKAFHEGLDFKGRTSDKIHATAAGTVKVSTYSKGWGHYIVIDHHNGYKTLFAHLSKRLVKRGAEVQRGMTIGLVGSSGRSTGSHLHYEIHLHGKPINPMQYVKVAGLSTTFQR